MLIAQRDMSDLSLTILPESPDDQPAIEHLNARTFGPGRFAKTAYRIREEVAHIPELSFTARVGTLLVGSVRLSPVLIGEAQALLLGPLTVEPPFRDRGIGQALMERALQEAKPGATAWWCWSATSPITARPASRRLPRARSS